MFLAKDIVQGAHKLNPDEVGGGERQTNAIRDTAAGLVASDCHDL